MPGYALVIAYEGTRFAGWQEQSANRTVAGVIKDSFSRAFGYSCTLVGASRTDAGVHALGQVACLRTDLAIDAKKLHFALQNQLPSDIYIRQVGVARPGYHPHHAVCWKEYQYYVARHRCLPGYAPFCAVYPYAIDAERFAWAMGQYWGTHDFWSFGSSSSDGAGVATVCTILHSTIAYIKQARAYRVTIRGDRFIHHMVRRMIGASLRYASYADVPESYLLSCLNERVDRMLIPTAPAQGLVLRKIMYTKGVAHGAIWS